MATLMRQGMPDYEITKVLGSGSFGFVFEAYDHFNKKKVALKRIEKVGKILSREWEILYDLKSCPHAVKLIDFYYSKSSQEKLIQNIVFEFMDDNLENMIQTKVKKELRFTERQVKLYGLQIFKGLEFMHSKSIVHRDLKPENVLFAKSGAIKICDFGSSKYIDAEGKNTPYIVSRYYRAPELIFCITKYGSPIDIWATGCIISELITREPLFQGKGESEQLQSIFSVVGTPSAREYQLLSDKIPFDAKLFKEFPVIPKNVPENSRWTQIFPDFKDRDQLVDLLERCFSYVPEERITAAEAVRHPFFDDVREDYQLLCMQLS